MEEEDHQISVETELVVSEESLLDTEPDLQRQKHCVIVPETSCSMSTLF